MTTTTTQPHGQRMTRQRIAEMRVACQQNPNDIELQRRTVGDFVAADLTAEAIPILRRLAALCPDDTTVTHQLAELLTALERHADAMTVYRTLADATPESIDLQHNYGVAACHARHYDDAIIAFERKLALDPKNYETLNDLAVLYALTDRYDDAARMYTQCLTVNPRYDRARDNAFQFFLDTQRFDEGVALAEQVLGVVGRDREVASWKQRLSNPESAEPSPTQHDTVTVRSDRAPTQVTGKRIGFVASSDAFLKPIVEHFAQGNQIRTFTGTSLRELAELLQWADLVWYEWCDQLVIEGSKLPRKAKTVCRLHSYEAFTNMPQQVNWANIDHLILVSDTVGEILDEASAVTSPRTVIHNGIDPNRFPMTQRPQLGKRIAAIGYINYKKNPSLLLQTFKAIHDWDPEFELHIAGQHQDPRIKVYMDNLLPRLNLPVTFHGWVDDMPRLYAETDYVISTSLFESFHYSIAEGMLSGCVPLIHTWRGADRLYPNDFLFNTPEDAVALIQRVQTQDLDTVRRDNREFIATRYHWTEKLNEIDELLDRVLNGDSMSRDHRTHTWPAPAEPVSSLDVGTVSVVIPVHNNARDARATLDSVLSQTYQNIEIIVTDDGSTDDLDKTLRAYEGRATVVRQIHRGCAAALNNAIQKANGRFIALALPGDSFAPQKMESQLRLFEHTPDLGIATCNTLETKDSSPTAENIAAAVNRCMETLTDNDASVTPSSIVFRRDLLQETGWFEEYAPYADNPSALAESLVRRTAAVSSVRHVDEQLVAGSPRKGTATATATATAAPAAVDRWVSHVTVGDDHQHEQKELGKTSATPQRSGLTIACVGAHDPRAQMMMWAEALSEYTPHTVRVLTHTERTGCPSDLVINRRGGARVSGQKAPSAMDVIADAERVAKDADLVIFAAGIAPGADRNDAQLADTDEQAFGTLEWSSVLNGKRCAALLFGTPSVRHNLEWYRDHFARKGWPILTCDPDIHRWLTESVYVPRLLSRTGNRYQPETRPFDNIIVLHPGGRAPHEGGTMFRDAAQRVKAGHPDVTFGLYDGMPW
ncbi:MAG: glycosyltransferase, partial [candidate division Zixibacteria bacterium]|nr:glycosyltransferase [candidate division Zixibacteria bacterium]